MCAFRSRLRAQLLPTRGAGLARGCMLIITCSIDDATTAYGAPPASRAGWVVAAAAAADADSAAANLPPLTVVCNRTDDDDYLPPKMIVVRRTDQAVPHPLYERTHVVPMQPNHSILSARDVQTLIHATQCCNPWHILWLAVLTMLAARWC